MGAAKELIHQPIAISGKKLSEDLGWSFQKVVAFLDKKDCPYERDGRDIVVHPA